MRFRGGKSGEGNELAHANYFKPKNHVYTVPPKNVMSRNKSIIRSSSSGSYPYPRTHTTLMVIPSNRPPPSPSSNKPPNKLFTGVRRRPPLNRACPPIPESKSNESIMSHASKISEKKVQTPQPIDDLIIENRNVTDVLDSNSNQIRQIPCTLVEKMSSNASSQKTPRSPLMNVAHSVKSKFSRITNIGRSSTSSSSSKSSIKTSQSFSGIRQPKTVAKRIDQNANRVIKSSSMDVSQPSTSKVSIPQDPTPLHNDKIEEISESGLVPKSEIAEIIRAPKEEFCVKLEEDVLVVTRQFDEQYPGQKRSASPDIHFDNNGNPSKNKTDEVVEKIVVIQEEIARPDVVVQHLFEKREASPEKFTMVQEIPKIEKENETKFILTVKTPEALRRHHTFTIADREKPNPETRISHSKSDCEVKPKKGSLVKQKSEPERFISPERYVMVVKTPEALRKHRTLTIGMRESVEEEPTTENLEKVVRLKRDTSRERSVEEPVPETKYVMVMKTPEALRKHRTLIVGPKEEREEQSETQNLEKVVKLKRDTSKERSIEEIVPETKYVMLMKTPEALRKHRTLIVGAKEEVEEEPATENLEKVVKLKRDKSKEREIPEEVPETKYVMLMKTPEALRKHRTLIVGQRTQSFDEEVVRNHQTTNSETKNLEKVAKLRRDTSIERVKKPEINFESENQPKKFVMIMKTPEALRRHHTFTVGDRPRSPDYPYIEEGELTEPIATVGPPAERRRRQENKDRKQREWEEYDKPPTDKYILTTTTPNTMRKYQTFIVEPKKQGTLPTSMSAEPVIQRNTVKRSESCDSKKSSYLKRLQFELFRGRSRERKSHESSEKRQKSLDERKPESAQKYILSTTTPVMMRKYQTFSIVNKKSEERDNYDYADDEKTNCESIAASYQSNPPANFYSITATTPVTSRKVFNEPEPEPRHLFVLGAGANGRRSPRETSHSDNAERKSTLSGDLTSPEEEIPMDTNLTPTMEEEPILSRRIDGLGLINSPIEEEPESLALSRSEASRGRPEPKFTAPSPPPMVQLIPKSTSTSSSASSGSSSSRKPTQLPIMSSLTSSSSAVPAAPVQNPMHIVELRPETQTKHQSKKGKIASKSLRNAGKMLTPSFLRKDRKDKKVHHAYVKTTTTGRQHVSEKVAPLAEGESSVVANSPLVENLPITFERWSEKSPRQGVKRFSETIVEEGLDGNANSLEHQIHHQNSTAPANDTGLIDDDIMDQPMLVGDTFSHSSSIDCISTTFAASQLPPTSQVNNFISESIISIDRSSMAAMNEITRNTPNRAENPRSPNINLTRQIDAGLCEVEDIKTQLQRLNKLVNEMGVSNWEDEITRLRIENEQLRRELAQRDATIASLQSQTVSA
ncbi:unnamed protein product [Caenorhabditis angaria]|uniref:Uncharacterized protein n=1 Tax=Caenorhabditis angaria TaxID=860376 RepID=A0A9P1N581_9PELO|nr:unnamed protein product [Caenorhabditis angaria]